MKQITLGKTGITVPQNAFGALPIQRVSREYAVKLLRRAPSQAWLTPEMQAEMKKIEGCLGCGQCMEKCPYDLNTPELLKKNYEDYRKVLTGEVKVQ